MISALFLLLECVAFSADAPGEQATGAADGAAAESSDVSSAGVDLNRGASLEINSDPGPSGTQSPCEWLLDRRNGGASLEQLISLARARSELFTSKDVRCLKDEGMHKSVLEAASGKLDARAERAAAAAERRAAAEAARALALDQSFDVELVAVIAGPAKAGNKPWDGGKPLPEAHTAALVQSIANYFVPGTGLVAAVGGADVVAAMTSRLQGATAAPDTYGYCEYIGPDVPSDWKGKRLSLRSPDDPMDNAVYATFAGTPGYRGIRMREGDVIRVTLYDADDLTDDDPMGVFDLIAADLEAAEHAGDLVMKDVRGVTGNQVLTVLFSARQAASTMESVRGTMF